MTYSLIFSRIAQKSWNKLGATVRAEFETILRRCLIEPHVPAAKLKGAPNLYKIKLRSAGYRLVYQVRDNELVVFVVGVGRRDETYELLRRLGRDGLSDD
ncbi:MAG: relE [Devosia sp.]|uniref:type II toxin-antitoxin system RelE family toxin n=1 Tax=Devosia sp. TaxID=1871048 RepID=UPI0026028E49|nr:type II toxin-antitoxin system RelE/ParE family toxin [Devosia sp.]MDB5539397.1 relE [Devosia sp.]